MSESDGRPPWCSPVEGASVACVDLDQDRAGGTAEMIRSSGGNAIGLAGDVSDPAACRRIVQETLAAFGGLDILVNNVGIARPMTLADVRVDDWRRLFDVNLTSALLMCSESVPHMAARGGGAIVNISSLAGMRATGSIGYGPSKAAPPISLAARSACCRVGRAFASTPLRPVM
jgi:NAD(P)-dependent dehydrogenase (short-subunit alcohol dehydrogenase family)